MVVRTESSRCANRVTERRKPLADGRQLSLRGSLEEEHRPAPAEKFLRATKSAELCAFDVELHQRHGGLPECGPRTINGDHSNSRPILRRRSWVDAQSRVRRVGSQDEVDIFLDVANRGLEEAYVCRSLIAMLRRRREAVPGAGSNATTLPSGPTARATGTVKRPTFAPASITVAPAFTKGPCLGRLDILAAHQRQACRLGKPRTHSSASGRGGIEVGSIWREARKDGPHDEALPRSVGVWMSHRRANHPMSSFSRLSKVTPPASERASAVDRTCR